MQPAGPSPLSNSTGTPPAFEKPRWLRDMLRFLPLKRFERHLVYYIDLPDHVEVIRVWHAARGLGALIGAD